MGKTQNYSQSLNLSLKYSLYLLDHGSLVNRHDITLHKKIDGNPFIHFQHPHHVYRRGQVKIADIDGFFYIKC